MVIEKQVTVYECPFCQKTYSQKEDAEQCETQCESKCAKLSGSPNISVLNLAPRTYNVLHRAGLDTVQEVLAMTDSELLKLRGLGKRSFRDLYKELQSFGNLTESEKSLRNVRQESLYTNNGMLDWTESLETQIKQFVDRQDWVGLYKGYQRHNDTWEKGFPDILRLETQMRCSLKNGEIKRQDILDVVRWVKHNPPIGVLTPKIIPFEDEISLLQTLKVLEQNVEGMGASYLTKVIRFVFPNRAGALDSSIARLFGIGDPIVNQYQWLTIRTKKYSLGWRIFRNRLWHLEYEKWLLILSKMVSLLNVKGVFCPHPEKFIETGLRTEGIWCSADVEMAIIAYATDVIR